MAITRLGQIGIGISAYGNWTPKGSFGLASGSSTAIAMIVDSSEGSRLRAMLSDQYAEFVYTAEIAPWLLSERN